MAKYRNRATRDSPSSNEEHMVLAPEYDRGVYDDQNLSADRARGQTARLPTTLGATTSSVGLNDTNHTSFCLL